MSIIVTTPLPLGKTILVLDQTETAAATRITRFSIDADSILVSVFVESIASGTIDVSVWTETDAGKELQVISFPSLSAVTSNLLLKKAAACMSRIYVKVVSTGVCKYEVRARGISAGELNVRIQGASTGSATNTTITNTASVLIPGSLSDRTALIIKNNNAVGKLYIGFTLAEATTTGGYPLGPTESLGIDIETGTVVYAIADVPSIDVRLLQAGG